MASRWCVVGHVTKDGQLAGPRVLEHVVDTVLSFEGDRHHDLRFAAGPEAPLRLDRGARPVRHGSTGLESVADPSGLFLGDRRPGIAGSLVTPAMEGHRPLLVEVQALVGRSQLPQPRRSVHGLDGGRVALLLAVLSRRVEAADRPAGHLRDGGRWREGHRAGRRPRDRAGPRLLAGRAAPARRRRRVRRGRPRRRAPPGRPGSSGGSPRRPDWGSPTPSCPAPRRRSTPRSSCCGCRHSPRRSTCSTSAPTTLTE